MQTNRTPSVLLLCGWIIMAPPVVEGPTGPVARLTAPLREWDQQHVYDTAKDCEAALTVVANHAADELVQGPKTPAPEMMSDSEWKAHLMAWNKARCVPAEAVYPPAQKR